MIRNKQHLAALRPYDGVLVSRPCTTPTRQQPESVDGRSKLQKAEVEMAKSLVET